MSFEPMDHTDSVESEISSPPIPEVMLNHFREFLRAKDADVVAFLQQIGGFPVLLQLVPVHYNDDLLLTVLDRVCRSEAGAAHLQSAESGPFVIGGLSFNVEEVQLVTLKCLSLLFQSPSGVRYLLSDPIFTSLLALVGCDSIKVSDEAANFLAVLASSPAGAEKLLTPPFVLSLRHYVKLADEVSLRALSLAARVGTVSSTHFELYSASGLLDDLLESIVSKRDDMLFLLNVLELISTVPEVKEGLQFLARSSVFDQLWTITEARHRAMVSAIEAARRAAEAQSRGRMAPFVAASTTDSALVNIVTGTMRLIERMAEASVKWPDVNWVEAPQVSRALTFALKFEEEATVQAAAISAVTSIACNPALLERMLAIDSSVAVDDEKLQVSIRESVLRFLPEFLVSAGDLRKVAALHGFASILSVGAPQVDPSVPIGTPISDVLFPRNHRRVPADPTVSAPLPVAARPSVVEPPALRPLGSQLQLTEKVDPPTRYQQIQLALFKSVRPEHLDVCYGHLLRPFEDLRQAVYRLLFELVRHSFGFRSFVLHAGNVEQLLDRATETLKVGAEWKYAIIRRVLANPLFSRTDLLTSEYKERIAAYVKEGVFYSKKEAQTLVQHEANN